MREREGHADSTPPAAAQATSMPYARLSVAAKQAHHRDRMREPPISCPGCETQIGVADAARHAATCPGRRDPHPLSEWVSWGEALKLGILEGTLCRWVKSGKVRHRGERDSREYLRHDLATELLARQKRISRGKPFPTGKRV